MTLPFTAYQGSDPFIFVSYAHEDADDVFAELQWMQSLGYNIWYDEGIGPGHHWPEELAKAIENCALFLFFVTPRSAESRNCQREINYALGKDKTFLAVHLEDTQLSSGLALELGDLQAIIKSKFTTEDYQQKLQQALQALIAQSAASQPTPTPQPPEAIQTPEVKVSTENSAAKAKSPVLKLVVGALVVMAAIGIGVWWQADQAQRQAAALQQSFADAVEQEDNLLAFRLAQSLELTPEQLASFSMQGELRTDPPGAQVSIAPYPASAAQADDWMVVGQTPLTMHWPLGGYRLKLEHEGYADTERLLVNPSATLGNLTFSSYLGGTPEIPLTKLDQYPDDMVYVPATRFVPMVMGFGIGPDAMFEHGAFLIDRYELTNKQYQAFVDAGGYERPEFWLEMTENEDANLSFDEAIARFTDSTGRIGPATWESGSFPLGKEDDPVAGVSWYEAVAYARFANKQLPSLAYWARAAYTPDGGGFGTNPHLSYMVPVSNFAGAGTQQVTDLKGLSPTGTYGQAGNVREWTSTSSGQERWNVGGASHDQSYLSSNYNSAHPLDRNVGNGFRLMRYLDDPPVNLLADHPLFGRESDAFVPVSDEVYATFEEQYQYSHTNLEPETQLVEEGGEWTWHRTSLQTDYDNTRFDVHIIRPKVNPKAETVLFFGGAYTVSPQPNSFDASSTMNAYDFILKSGRTVVVVELYESYSRSTKYVQTTNPEVREWLLRWHSDLGRTLDYLQSRKEEFGDTYTWYGASYGASVQLPLLALEDRFSSAMLVIGGVLQSKVSMRFIDNINYIPRIKVPVLFMTGNQDSVFPVKYSQEPFLELVGTPKDQLRHVAFDGSHMMPPRRLLVRELVNWLDSKQQQSE